MLRANKQFALKILNFILNYITRAHVNCNNHLPLLIHYLHNKGLTEREKKPYIAINIQKRTPEISKLKDRIDSEMDQIPH